MSVTPSVSDPQDPHVAVAIARAERRRAKLERMSDVGMELVEQIGAHSAASRAAINEERAGDPSRAFATVSRAVRMTLALEARVDNEILALHRGEIPGLRGVRAPAASPVADVDTAAPIVKHPDPRRDRAGDAVREAIRLEVESINEAHETLDALNERLFDRETYDVLLSLPLRDAVAAICADLDIAPDWSLWTDETGFVSPPGRRRVDWPVLCAQSPRPGAARAKSPPAHRRQ